jgi:hypothetical protein
MLRDFEAIKSRTNLLGLGELRRSMLLARDSVNQSGVVEVTYGGVRVGNHARWGPSVEELGFHARDGILPVKSRFNHPR